MLDVRLNEYHVFIKIMLHGKELNISNSTCSHDKTPGCLRVTDRNQDEVYAGVLR